MAEASDDRSTVAPEAAEEDDQFQSSEESSGENGSMGDSLSHSQSDTDSVDDEGSDVSDSEPSGSGVVANWGEGPLPSRLPEPENHVHTHRHRHYHQHDYHTHNKHKHKFAINVYYFNLYPALHHKERRSDDDDGGHAPQPSACLAVEGRLRDQTMQVRDPENKAQTKADPAQPSASVELERPAKFRRMNAQSLEHINFMDLDSETSSQGKAMGD